MTPNGKVYVQGSEMLSLPLVIMGILSVLGGMAAFRLPETLHQPLPNTIREGEEFGARFTWRDCWSCKPKDDGCVLMFIVSVFFTILHT